LSAAGTARHAHLDWLVVGLGFLALALIYAMRALLGVTMTPWIEEERWSRELISGVMSASLVVMALVAPVSGHILDRLGPRVVLGGGLLALAAGSALTAAVGAPWQLFIGYGGISAIGFGVGTVSAVATVVLNTVGERSGLKVGFATSGATAGQLLLVPLLSAIVADFGWRAGYLTVAATALALGLAGWMLAGRWRAARWAEARHDDAGRGIPALTSLGDFLRSRIFHALFWSFTVCGFTTTGVIETHLIPYAEFCGFPPVPSATIYGLLSGVNLLGMVLAGWLTDHLHRPLLLGSLYVIRALTFVFLVLIGPDFELMLVFAVLFGLVDYATIPVTTSIARSRFGIGRLGLVMGMMSAGHAMGGALGAYLGGALSEGLGSYQWVWLSAVAIALLGGLMAYSIPEPDRPLPWRRALARPA
jgi:MFS family permease